MTVRPITHSMTATEVMQGVTEVLCYGTAVVADRVQL
jgi:hypothetical protein